MIKPLLIFVILILADRNVHPINVNSDYASAKLLQSEITAEVIMFIPIPGFPSYQFNNETLEVKSLNQTIKHLGGYRIVKGRILKPWRIAGGYFKFHLSNKNGAKKLKRSYICWLTNTGSLPPKNLQIDHIDGNKTNDKFSNLQLLTPRENTSKGFQMNGKKLPTGVTWHKRIKKYQSRITINSKLKHLGYFGIIKEASNAYQIELLKIEDSECQ